MAIDNRKSFEYIYDTFLDNNHLLPVKPRVDRQRIAGSLCSTNGAGMQRLRSIADVVVQSSIRITW